VGEIWLVRVSALGSIQCFHMVGWAPVGKSMFHLSPKLLF